MSRVLHVLYLVAGGVVGAWAGYWIGHRLGWSEGAEWPWQIGGGTGAILLSIAGAVLVVVVAQLVTPRRQ